MLLLWSDILCVCDVHACTYKPMLEPIPTWMHVVQWRMLSVFLYHSPPYSFETDSVIESGRRLMTSKPHILASYLISSEFHNFVIEVINITPRHFCSYCYCLWDCFLDLHFKVCFQTKCVFSILNTYTFI